MNKESQDPHSAKERTGEKIGKLFVPELTLGKLAFLVSIAMLLVFTGTIMLLFAAIPLSISFLLYGKKKAFAANGLMLAVCAGLMLTSQAFIVPFIGYCIALTFGYLVARVIWRNENPVFGAVKNGSIVLAVIFTILGGVELKSPGLIKTSITEVVVKQATALHKGFSQTVGAQGEVIRLLQDLIEKPEVMVDQVMTYGVSSIVMVIFLTFWVGVFIVLKNAPVWRSFQSYDYSSKEMVSFRMPFEMVWPLIAGLILCVSHAYGVTGSWANVIGANVLLSLGVFYFFQGLGIFTELLAYWRIVGFFRTMFVLFVAMTSYELLALAGVLDTWVDFRRFFNKKNKSEGDIL
jgi:hypothetical protein